MNWPLVILAANSFPQAPDQCVTFEDPKPDAPVTAAACTVSLQTCESVRSVMIKAHYFSEDGATADTVVLGSISRPPFKLVWNISDVPNQLGRGVTLFAVATMKNGSAQIRKCEGIFFRHKPVARPSYEAAYGSKPDDRRRNAMILGSALSHVQANASIAWDKTGCMFRIDVNDPLFYTGLPSKKLDSIGVEILIDRHNRRLTHLTDDILILTIPVSGQPAIVHAKPKRESDGSFAIRRIKVPYPLSSSIQKADFKGYTIRISIPWKELDLRRQKSFGCNVLARVVDEEGHIHTLSWARQAGEAVYAPCSWGEVRLADKPLLADFLIACILSFIAGCAAGSLAILVYRQVVRLGTPLSRFEQSEEDEREAAIVEQAIHAQVTKTDLTITDISLKTAISPKKINRLIRRKHGETFTSFLMRSRIEIAKERLRSSHSSEASIASSCGFSSVTQMEKYFRKFYRTTPYKYREHYQVT